MCDANCGGGKCTIAKIGKILLIIGGINWGLVGVGMLLGNSLDAWNVVNKLLGSWPVVEAIVYVLVGVAAIIKIFGCRCKTCAGACTSGADMNKGV
ncbi:MAG: DUF378 domain-containing protein [Patescibacteria group bacterium]